MRKCSAIFLLLLCSTTFAGEWSGNVSVEARYFLDEAILPTQSNSNFAAALQPEYRTEWDKGYQSITFTPFIRLDNQDDERTHADIRELLWIKAEKNWELRTGISKVFWGVTESQHLVDIINQSDMIENQDGEDKLGQAMINLSLINDWGIVDLFILPGFRERSFPGQDGRLRTIPSVDTNQAIYESSKEDKHIDYALRWSNTFGDWDVGLSHFYGTSRDPDFIPGTDGSGNPVLLPRYTIINQTGVDIQATLESWLWKLEAIHRSNKDNSYNALTAGFEYSFYGIMESDTDLGIVSEYLYDNRDEAAPTPFQNDIMLGFRLALNDTQSTDALIGTIIDLDTDTVFYNIEASRRIGNSWKLNLEIRTASSVPIKDDHLLLDLAYYF